MARPLDPGRLVVGYYLATPVFAVADVGMGLPVRVADVLPLAPRLGYYGVVFALGLLCAARPRAVPWVGMGESVTNLVILLLSILLPIWSSFETVAAGGGMTGGLDASGAANALLSGTALVMSFHRHQATALGGGAGGRSGPGLPGL